MTRRARKAVAPGIYPTPTGFRVFVWVTPARKHGKLLTKRFPPSATLPSMKLWQDEQRVLAKQQRGPATWYGTLADDIDRYLGQVAAMPTIAWRRRDLSAWRDVLGDTARAAITPAMIRAQLQIWRTEGPVLTFFPRSKTYRSVKRPLSASACNHRRTALLHLYTILDGKDAPNPVRAVKPFDEPAPQPRGRDLELLRAAIVRIKNPASRARAAVLLWTGIRGNSELAPMAREHVDLEGAVCHVPTGKGGRAFRTVPLNTHGVLAWQDFIAAKAWGPYDKDALRKSIQAAVRAEAKARGVPAPPVRTYDLRHTIATSLLNAGADLADVQSMLGHTTPRMTRRYAPFHSAKLTAAAKRLE